MSTNRKGPPSEDRGAQLVAACAEALAVQNQPKQTLQQNYPDDKFCDLRSECLAAEERTGEAFAELRAWKEEKIRWRDRFVRRPLYRVPNGIDQFEVGYFIAAYGGTVRHVDTGSIACDCEHRQLGRCCLWLGKARKGHDTVTVRLWGPAKCCLDEFLTKMPWLPENQS